MPQSPPRHKVRATRSNRSAIQRAYDRNKRKNVEFYHSSAWRKLRAWHVKQYPICMECKKNGRATPVDVVDHIEEISDGGARLDASNLMSLCHAHHNMKSAKVREERHRGLNDSYSP